MTQELIVELEGVAAAAELFIDRFYRAKQKLESVYSPTSPKRGALSEKEAAKIIAKRMKSVHKSRKP